MPPVLVALSLGAAALLALPAGVAAQAARAGRQGAPVAADAGVAFREPPVLANESREPGRVEVTLTAAPGRMELLPGKPTHILAYNGCIPGPTLELTEGDHVVVHFHNQLSEPTTIHWHGLHVPAAADGSPLLPVPPGGSYDYVFTIQRGTAGTYWYHPHPDMRGGYQVAKGLYGAIVVRARDDPLRGIPERLLILADNRFLPDGSMDFPEPHSAQGELDAENGREGDVLFVNGRIAPTLPIHPGEVQRWRIVNASAARMYRLAVPGQTLLQVGTDGGLIEHPVEVPDVVLANSERVELLVRGTGAPGSTGVLLDLPYDRYVPQTRPENWNVPRDLLTLAYSTDSVPPPAIPAVLRPVPALDTAAVTSTQLVVLSQGLINGRTMDLHRVDLHARLGTTEIWRLENVVGMDHPFHLHGFRFQVLDRDGVPEPFRGWKDTVDVPKHEVVRLVVRYEDYPGKWMFHCHIMDHEDMGMMGILEVH